MKNINTKTYNSCSQRKLHTLLQGVFSTDHYTIDTTFHTPTHWANVYKISLDRGALYQPCDRTYIVRVLNPVQSTLEDRQKEVMLTQKMSDLGIAPKMYYGNPYIGVMVMEYIVPKPMAGNSSALLLGTLAHKLRKVHGMDARPYMPLGNQKLDGLLDRVAHVTKPERHLLNPGHMKPSKFIMFEETLNAYMTLKRMLEVDRKNSGTLCHLDLNKTNLLFDGQQAWMIDWDMTDQGDIYFDLATVINTLSLNASQEAFFLQAYFGKKLSETSLARLHVMKQVCYLRYALTTFGLCTAYKALPAPQGIMETLKPAFVFPQAEKEKISKSMALYKLAMAFYKAAKTHMAAPKFTQALQTLNHPQESMHEHLKPFCHH